MSNLTRRKLLGSTAVLLGAYAVTGASCASFATLAPTIVEYITNTANALKASLGVLAGIANLPATWSATLMQIQGWVADIGTIAGGISTGTLVSTATGGIVNVVNDFNQIVQSILSNPIVVAAVSSTSFGWALSAASVLLPLIEAAVNVVVNIVSPPAPTPIPAPASSRMTARLTATLDPNTANLILQEIAAGAH
jgi:hypothetical protein